MHSTPPRAALRDYDMVEGELPDPLLDENLVVATAALGQMLTVLCNRASSHAPQFELSRIPGSWAARAHTSAGLITLYSSAAGLILVSSQIHAVWMSRIAQCGETTMDLPLKRPAAPTAACAKEATTQTPDVAVGVLSRGAEREACLPRIPGPTLRLDPRPDPPPPLVPLQDAAERTRVARLAQLGLRQRTGPSPWQMLKDGNGGRTYSPPPPPLRIYSARPHEPRRTAVGRAAATAASEASCLTEAPPPPPPAPRLDPCSPTGSAPPTMHLGEPLSPACAAGKVNAATSLLDKPMADAPPRLVLGGKPPHVIKSEAAARAKAQSLARMGL